MELDAKPFLLFDDQDLELVEMVNDFAGASKKRQRARRLFNTYLHPRGINELSASRQRRIAYAVMQLLDSLEGDWAEDRLVALRALRQELIEGGGESMPRNTGRALLETMKHLVREAHGNSWHQVEIAHQFFATTAGRPSTVRRQLARHHLLEMSESWNQVAFDHHVHDAHTKGRKAPTHLVVDAWIKGIRQMTVIYYYCPSTEAISELIEAGQVMGVDVRPGIEVTARLRGKYVQLIWVLRGLHSAREHADFLERAETRAFLDEGRKAVEYNTNAVLDLLRSVNDNHLPRLRAEYALDLPPLDAERFVHFVGVGQPSRAHLVEFLHQGLVAEVQAKLPAWREEWQKAAGAERRAIEERVQRLDAITTQDLASTVLSAAANPDVVDVHIPHDDPSVPDCLRQAPVDLVRRLRQLRVGSAVTLNPSNLTAAEVLEILYDGKAGVTDLEIFNLKDYHQKRNPQTREIAQIVQILNDGNPITCKRMIRGAHTRHREERRGGRRQGRPALEDAPHPRRHAEPALPLCKDSARHARRQRLGRPGARALRHGPRRDGDAAGEGAAGVSPPSGDARGHPHRDRDGARHHLDPAPQPHPRPRRRAALPAALSGPARARLRSQGAAPGLAQRDGHGGQGQRHHPRRHARGAGQRLLARAARGGQLPPGAAGGATSAPASATS